ncbi:hypothetical protein [Bordetella sp. 15P40C-2]|uniref:hypothetical protein n=1 Tax=Bordetella sp. 15P40C-2 TaxID=2572246 RepID=UPI001321CB7A|nr:hypothetical protein [Bordetella sp. 15P40C-2]MVW70696.1 hypothetical protein [Bordetella sp. 15P40C-2]
MKHLFATAVLACASASALCAEAKNPANEFGTTANFIKECSVDGKGGRPTNDCRKMFEMTLQALTYATDLLKTGAMEAATPQTRMAIRNVSASYDCQKASDRTDAIRIVVDRIKARDYLANGPALVEIVNALAEEPICGKLGN